MSDFVIHIPIRNNSLFDKIVFIEGDYGSFLLIPKMLASNSPYAGDDWVNRKEAYFYPHDSYVLIAATDTAGKQELEERLLKSVNAIIFEINTTFNSSLVPHAFSNRDLVPDRGVLESGAIKVNPLLQPDDYKDKKLGKILDSLRPYYNENRSGSNLWLSLLQRHRLVGNLSHKDLVELINQKINHNSWLDSVDSLGALVLDKVDDNLPSSSPSNIRTDWGKYASAKLNDPKFLLMLADFLTDLNGEKSDDYSKGLSRRYWEMGGWDGPVSPPSLIKEDDIPEELIKESLITEYVSFLDARELSDMKDYIHNSLITIREKKSLNNDFKALKIRFNLHDIHHLVLKNKNFDPFRLSYYIDAFSASRPGIRFLHLYQVLESLMTKTGESELKRLKDILARNFSLTDLDPELSNLISNHVVLPGYEDIQLSNSIESLAKSIYKVRCMVAHAKAGEITIVPYSKEEFDMVPQYFEIMNKIAVKLISVP